MQSTCGPEPVNPSHHQVCWKRGEGMHRKRVGTRAVGLGWGAKAGPPAQTRVPLRIGDVSRRSTPVLVLEAAKSSSQLLRPASKVTCSSACGMPLLSHMGTHLFLPAPRGQASARLSVPTAAAGGAAGGLMAAIAAFIRCL